MPVLISKKYKNSKKWYIVENDYQQETLESGEIVNKNKRKYLENLGVMTKTEAKNKLTEYFSLNNNISNADITFRVLVEEFRAFYKTQLGQIIKQKTYDLFFINSEKMLKYFDRMLIKNIEFTNIEAFKISLRDDCKLSNRSINIILTDLKKVFDYAYERKWVVNYPTIKRVSEQKANKEIEYLNKNDIETILKYADDKRAFYIQLMLYTGMRPHEASNLKWKDINLVEKSIYIISDNPKKKGRKIPIHSTLLGILEMLRVDYLPEDNVSPYLDAQVARKSMKRLQALVKARTDKDIECNPYKFRKTFGSLLAQRGVDTINVAHLMGHSKLQTTYQYYINQNEDNLRKTIEKL